MNPLDVMLFVLAAVVVCVLLAIADEIGKANDDNGYNNEQGTQDDDA